MHKYNQNRRGRSLLALILATVVGATLLIGSTSATSANAATKTTKKTTKKSSKTTKSSGKKVKTTTTKKRKPPPPAKGSKRINGLWQPNGRAPFPPLNFDPNPPSQDPANPSAKDDVLAYAQVEPTNAIFSLLVVGTDARPNERPEKTRGDSIHVFTYNPVLKKASLVGFPRDAYVTSPSGASRRINEIMATEGPDAFLATVNGLTGLGTKRYILTGFDGFKKIVDGVGGVNVLVDPQINDVASGAQFSRGWFQFNGAAALAYARARKSLPLGDFDRSANQAKLIVYGFDRLRESTDNIPRFLTGFSCSDGTPSPM